MTLLDHPTAHIVTAAPLWARVDASTLPDIKVSTPGPKSKALHARCTKHFKGLSSQVKLFPVAFESGEGCVLTDVDGNRYIDFSSGIYVTTLGHCHPKISEAVAKYARQLMNAHDFTTEIKTRLVEKLADVLPGDLNGFQFYDSGTTAVEAGMRVMRAATGKNELISCFYDYHGKSYGAVSLAHIRSPVYGRVRAPGIRHARSAWSAVAACPFFVLSPAPNRHRATTPANSAICAMPSTRSAFAS